MKARSGLQSDNGAWRKSFLLSSVFSGLGEQQEQRKLKTTSRIAPSTILLN